MKLDILPIRELVGASLPFDYTLDLSDLELYGEYPVETVRVSGFAEHRADLFLLHMDLFYTFNTVCARCLKPLELEQDIEIERVMVDSVENEDELNEEEILVLKDGFADLDEAVREAVIFNTEMSYLCSPNCRGLCPRCGHDLNEGSCSCPPEVDDRLASIADLLDKFD